MSIILFLSGNLIPYRDDEPNSGINRIIKEYVDPSTPESAFIRDVVNKSVKSIATYASKSNKVKGGAPEFDNDSSVRSKRNKKGDERNGRGQRDNGNNRGNGEANSSLHYSSEDGRSATRGYHNREGSSCILFSSGISSGLTINTRIAATNYTPLILSSGYLFKVTDDNIDANTEFNNQLLNIIYPLIGSVISNRINRYYNRYVTPTDFVNYLYAIIEALQVYYCIDNVFTYGSNTSRDNINVGMEHLSSRISSEAIVEFNLLRDYICTCGCPPNLLNYIRYMCQSFRTSDAPHSTIIKLNIGGMFDEDWTDSDHLAVMIRSCRTKLVATNTPLNYLLQAFPNWLIGIPPMSSNVACYDISFFTFWHNQNCAYLSTSPGNKGNFEYSIEVPNLDSYTDYQIIQRDVNVDGLMFVSQTYNVVLDDKKKMSSFWGIWQPLASVVDKTTSPGKLYDTFNIRCFVPGSAIKSITDPVTLGSSGIYNLVTYSGVTGNFVAQRSKFGTYGFVKLQNVSVRMQTEAFNEAMRYLFL